MAFPSIADVALRVNHLGKSSVTYEIAIFEREAEDVRAVGTFTHVFVERDIKRPAVDGMLSEIRTGLQKLLLPQGSKL